MPDGTVKDIEDEIPFDVPEGWAWCRLGEICDLKAGKSISATDIFSDNSDAKYLCYGGNGIRGYVKTYNRDGDYVLIGRQGALCGNINYAFGKFYATEHAVVVENRIDIDIGCLGLFLETLNLNQYATSTAQPGLSVKTISEVFFPLPPLNEQCRIVERIKRLFNLIDSLEKDRTDLQIAVKQAKSKILDLAIHGKLVPQNPSDEPASVLLEKLRAEKEAKIKSGELKRDKNDSYIYKSTTDNCHCEKFADGTVRDIEDEIPFDIPESWAWTKIRCISSEILYGVSESAKETEKYKLLRITDIQDDKVNWDSVPFTDYPEEKVTNYILKNGDIVFARTGATVGKSYLIENLTVKSIYASYLIRIRTSQVLNQKYIKYYFGSQTYWNQITDKSSGIGQPNVNGTSLANLYIPLPPLAEQKRIVEKIENAFAKLAFIAEQLV